MVFKVRFTPLLVGMITLTYLTGKLIPMLTIVTSIMVEH